MNFTLNFYELVQVILETALKETEKGVLELSSELQQFVDEENEKASKDTGKLIFYLMKKGRVDDAEKAIEDKYYRLKLLTEFRNGVLGAN